MPEKAFAYRQSILSQLFEISHFRTLQNIFVAVLVCWAVNTAVNDALSADDWKAAIPDLEMLSWTFRDFHVVVIEWTKLFICSIAIYPLFQLWVFCRETVSCKSKQRIVDILAFGLCVMFEFFFVVVPCQRVLMEKGLAVGCACVFACEQTRLLMKIHAFVRENTRRVLASDQAATKERGNSLVQEIDKLSETIDSSDGELRRRKTNSTNITEGSTNENVTSSPPKSGYTRNFSKYLYFLFAPTLVYRDNYPRTNHINWWFVFSNFAQFLLCVMYSYYLLYRYVMPEVHALASSTEFSLKLFIVCWTRCAGPGLLLFLVAHFGFLHSWLNAFAEMLRFADREFYKDWWNAVSFSAYYRDWNRVVHDWLYTYVYTDILRVFGKQSKIIAALSVFALSCFFHQYIIVCSMKFYLPFFEFSMFITGLLSVFVTPKSSHRNRPLNVAMWVAMIFGNGLMICLYTMEWAARGRYETAFPSDSIADFFLPRCLFYVKHNASA